MHRKVNKGTTQPQSVPLHWHRHHHGHSLGVNAPDNYLLCSQIGSIRHYTDSVLELAQGRLLNPVQLIQTFSHTCPLAIRISVHINGVRSTQCPSLFFSIIVFRHFVCNLFNTMATCQIYDYPNKDSEKTVKKYLHLSLLWSGIIVSHTPFCRIQVQL